MRGVKLSVVATMYRSAGYVREFHQRASEAAQAITDDYEIVLVNDGSPDDSLAAAIELHRTDPRVVVVDLSRNFGHHRAMMAGLRHARGELVFLIDIDLEEDPAELIRFHERLQKGDCDVVYGVQAIRRGHIGERISGELFYWLISKLGGVSIPRNLTTVRLMTRRYVDNLIRHEERDVVISGLWMLTGFEQAALTVEKTERRARSNYHIGRKVRLALDYVTSFSATPLYFAFNAGLALSIASSVICAFFIIRYLITQDALAGWTSLMASIWMFGGISVLLIGFIGIYVARIFEETKRRPYMIVRHLYRTDADYD